VRSELLCDITQRTTVIPYRRFGKIYGPIFKSKEIQDLFTPEKRTEISLPLKMGPIGFPETSVRNYNYLLCNIPAEPSSHLYCGRNMKWTTGSSYVCLGHSASTKIWHIFSKFNIASFHWKILSKSHYQPYWTVKNVKSAPLYRHWGSVQAVRPIGGVEV